MIFTKCFPRFTGAVRMIRSGAAEKPRRMHFSIHNFFHHNPSITEENPR